MAVIVRYIVERNGVEKMTFTTKKEADAYDKMLDIADNLFEFIESAELDIDESKIEDLSLFLAENKDTTLSLLRGVKPIAETKQKQKKDEPDKKEPEKKKATVKKDKK